MKSFGLYPIIKLMTCVYLSIIFTSCTKSKVSKDIEAIWFIEFADVNSDSAYFAKGFERAKIYDDSLDNVQAHKDSNDHTAIANYQNISLDYLDKIDTNISIKREISFVAKPKKAPPKRQNSDFDRQYIAFLKAVQDGRKKLGIKYDTTKNR